MSKNNKNGHSTLGSMQSAKAEDASSVATAVGNAPMPSSDRGIVSGVDTDSVETTSTTEVAEAGNAAGTPDTDVETTEVSETKATDTTGTPDVVIIPPKPKAMSAKERCQALARKFETTGEQPLQNLDAAVYANVKFRGKVQPVKGWSADALAGKKMGELSVDTVIEAATIHIADNQQGSREQCKRGTVTVGLNAQRDVILPKEAAEVLAGEFYKQCTAE